MQGSSKNLSKKVKIDDSISEFENFFSEPPDENQTSWSIVNDFLHMVLTMMKNQNITRAELARRLGRSRSSVSQLLNKTPNLTIKKMVEIAMAVGLDLKLSSDQVPLEEPIEKYIFVYPNLHRGISYIPDRDITEILDNLSLEIIEEPKWFNSEKVVTSH